MKVVEMRKNIGHLPGFHIRVYEEGKLKQTYGERLVPEDCGLYVHMWEMSGDGEDPDRGFLGITRNPYERGKKVMSRVLKAGIETARYYGCKFKDRTRQRPARSKENRLCPE